MAMAIATGPRNSLFVLRGEDDLAEENEEAEPSAGAYPDELN